MLMAVSLVLFCSCHPVLTPFNENVPAHTLTYMGAPPVSDARVRFREIFCELLRQSRQRHDLNVDCDSFLWRLNDEAHTAPKPIDLPDHDPSLVVLTVPGAFSECVGDIGKPYQRAAERLRHMGYRISNIEVSGLSSCQTNAEIIAGVVAQQDLDRSQRLVLLGYSKGTTDILHFLVNFPELADRVDAVLSVSGAVNGTPLADRYHTAKYDNWITKRSLGKCKPGDGGVLDSLSRIGQFQWLATHPLPTRIRYYSLASFARNEDMQFLQARTNKLLSKIDPLNDGQILMVDQIIPGSALLGYVNADHWTVAVPMEEKYSNRDPTQQELNRKLRDLLFEAMILFLADNLNRGSELACGRVP